MHIHLQQNMPFLQETQPYLEQLQTNITASQEIVTDLLNNSITNVQMFRQQLIPGEGIPVFYNCSDRECRDELLQREIGLSIRVDAGEVALYHTQLSVQIVDYSFQYIQNDAFNNRKQSKQGFLSFDDRQRVLLNPSNNYCGIWTTNTHISTDFHRNTDIIDAIFKYIQNKSKKVTFTKQASFLLINFGITPTAFLIQSGPIKEQIIHSIHESVVSITKPPKLKNSNKMKLWENFLIKNSVSSDLQVSLSDQDRLEQQIRQLTKDYDAIMQLFKDSVPTSEASHSHGYSGLLQQSSQKLFTGRSHLETKRGYHLSVGQLSENSFYQDAPVINTIGHY